MKQTLNCTVVMWKVAIKNIILTCYSLPQGN